MSEDYMEEMAREYNKALKDVDLNRVSSALADTRLNGAESDLARRIRDARGGNLIKSATEIIELQIAYIDSLLGQSTGRTRHKVISYLRSLKFASLRRLNNLLSMDAFIPSHSEPLFGYTQPQIISALASLQVDLFQVLDTIAASTEINDILALENRAMSFIAALS
ncbi:MAG: hypothetical protein ACOYIQ_06015 [Christensenellales bacterium]|jgi:hypothetical protein